MSAFNLFGLGARPGGLWISLCLHIGSWCCSERLDCARTPPWEPSWGRNGPHGPEPLDFIVLALGCSKNRYTRPAQGGGAGLLIYSQNRWPRTLITYKKNHCRCSVFCTYTKHYRCARTPITYKKNTAGVVFFVPIQNTTGVPEPPLPILLASIAWMMLALSMGRRTV